MKCKYIKYLFVIYLFANVLMLFNNGIFWDDWTVYKMDEIGLMQQFGENGFWIMVYVHDFLNSSNYSPLLYHFLSFVFLFGIAWYFFKLLKQFGINESTAFLISLLALLSPYFETRNTMICMAYSLFLFFFTLGLYLVLSFIEERKQYKNLIFGCIFLLTGFFLNSLLPLFLFILGLHFLYKRDFSFVKIKKSDSKAILHYSILALLPFIFWGLKRVFFPITGVYASTGYNKINIVWKDLPGKYLDLFNDNIIGVYNEIVTLYLSNLTLGIVVFLVSIVLLLVLLRNFKFNDNYSKLRLGVFFFFGIFTFLVVMFPYIVVNKLPSYTGYDTRHQILLPLVLSFLLISIILVFSKGLRKLLYVVILALFITITINSNISFLSGWIKMEAIKQNVSLLSENKSGIIFTEGFNAQYNATERELIFYELNGIFKEVLGKEDKFILANDRYQKHLPTFLAHAELYSMRNLSKDINTDVVLKIDYDELNFSKLEIIKCVFYYYWDNNKFKERVKNKLSLEYQPKIVL